MDKTARHREGKEILRRKDYGKKKEEVTTERRKQIASVQCTVRKNTRRKRACIQIQTSQRFII
jgi:hypothetical protein